MTHGNIVAKESKLQACAKELDDRKSKIARQAIPI
jgi:hypothetical protein